MIRYVPDVARGEQVNVAVIAGRDGGDWAIGVVPDLRRASRLGGDASALRPWLDRLDATIREYQAPPLELFDSVEQRQLNSAWVGLISHRFNNTLQVSDPVPVVARSAQSAVDFLFPVLIAAPATIKRSRTRTRLLGDMNDFYLRTADLEAGTSLLRRPLASIGRQRGRFDFAVVNDAVGQLSQVFAFDVRDTDALEQELHSWNYIVTRLRQDSGEVRGSSLVPIRVPSTVPISVVYQTPDEARDNRRDDVFFAAMEAWAELDVRAVPSEQLDQVAREARSLVGA